MRERLAVVRVEAFDQGQDSREPTGELGEIDAGVAIFWRLLLKGVRDAGELLAFRRAEQRELGRRVRHQILISDHLARGQLREGGKVPPDQLHLPIQPVLDLAKPRGESGIHPLGDDAAAVMGKEVERLPGGQRRERRADDGEDGKIPGEILRKGREQGRVLDAQQEIGRQRPVDRQRLDISDPGP